MTGADVPWAGCDVPAPDAPLAVEAAPQSRTVGEALRLAEEALERSFVPDPRREAAELYAALVRRTTSAAWTDRDACVPAELLGELCAAARRRAAGWPQAYAAGWACFRGHWLRVDRRVLIPRPETEGLVELVLAWARGRVPPGGVLPAGAAAAGAAPAGGPGLVAADVGTGSGAIAVALALEGPFERVWAVDSSAGALEVAEGNVARLGVAPRVSLVRGDLLEPLAGRRLDVVAGNPPYVATAELAAVDAAVRDHEPLLALDGGLDGLGPTRLLVAAAGGVLAPGGLLALEVDSRRAGETAALVGTAGFCGVELRNDLFQRPRYVTARQPGDG